MRVLFRIVYNGQSFYGWQSQIPTQPTVQRTLQTWLSKLYQRKISVLSASRTDRGVHARGHLATADLPTQRFGLQELRNKLNTILKPHVFVEAIEVVAKDFKLRFHVQSKVYWYMLCSRLSLRPFLGEMAHFVTTDQSDPKVLAPYLLRFQGTHDFVNFASTGSPTQTTIRSVLDIRSRRVGPLTVIRVHGNGFLKQMVRNMVGAVLELIRRGHPPTRIQTFLDAPQRSSLIVPAPAHALTLMRMVLG